MRGTGGPETGELGCFCYVSFFALFFFTTALRQFGLERDSLRVAFIVWFALWLLGLIFSVVRLRFCSVWMDRLWEGLLAALLLLCLVSAIACLVGWIF